MIPSLVVGEIRRALVEYLTTTFALTDDDVRDALTAFLEGEDGIFRGPYLRVKTPFETVDADWESPLGWMPDGFRPWHHQAAAFERLSTVGGRTPEPTIVTTGTGSGKTESFLFPILDHCARMRAQGRRGIKALILYPMNALASDQAGRVAETIHQEALLAGVTAGMYVGDQGRHSSMGADHIIDKREVLRDDPPDIVLTNYKMLDFLLLRREDRDLWADNEPDTLQYVVLDEFHTYDGAQGTDVAMLLRRLGQTLKMAGPSGPLGTAVPVATSATLGSGARAEQDMTEFAAKIFGRPIDDEAVIGERLQTVAAACGPVNYYLPIPNPEELLGVDELNAVAAAFCHDPEEPDLPDLPPGDLVALGNRLLGHPLTRAVLDATGDRSRAIEDAIAEINVRAADWGRIHMRNPAAVESALVKFMWLLSVARRDVGGHARPLFSIQVQLWIREVSRVLRSVQLEPAFRWRDSGIAEPDPEGDHHALELPAIYCRRCGSSGWMAIHSPLTTALRTNPASIYQASLRRDPELRALLRAHPDIPGVAHFNTVNHEIISKATGDSVPVLITRGEDEAKSSTCPVCGERDVIRFLGTQIASLASVSLSTLFGSNQVEAGQRKLIAFTDSVQDASHRAAFFSGRTYRFNLRALMAGVICEAGEVRLANLGDLVLQTAGDLRDWYGLVPPDLSLHRAVKTVWTDRPSEEGRQLLRQRLAFEAQVEFGLRSRVGRTLELVGASAAEIDLPDLQAVVDLLGEKLENDLGALDTATLVALPHYLRGLVERLRLRGGITHEFLKPYVADNGRQWHVWGGRPDGLPPFTPGQSRPVFMTTVPKGDFDSLTAVGTTPTWAVDWAVRSLGVEPAQAASANRSALALLASETDSIDVTTTGSNLVYAINPAAVRIVDVEDSSQSRLKCATCGHRHVAPPDRINFWDGAACMRYRCPGRFKIVDDGRRDYYREFYRDGQPRRVVTGEHTGLLGRQDREDLEQAFKSGDAPDSPNVITATPTLEMGIDIGDLSAVMLTSVPPKPANYIQRVGRAGRATGNALVTTFAPGDTHGLYYLSQPDAMINGEVVAPNCYLNAGETLQRQFNAYLLDRIADLTIEGNSPDRKIGEVINRGLDEGGVLRRIIDAAMHDPHHVESFIDLFGPHLSTDSAATLREYAGAGVEVAIKSAVEVWQSDYKDLVNRRNRLSKGIDRLEAKERTRAEDEQLGDLRGQRASVGKLLGDMRGEYSLIGLERLGVLPNYTLIDDATTLDVTMWAKDDAGKYEVKHYEYARPGALAISEFAPGNSFYAAGHRHVVDALEIGSAAQKLHDEWRLCPDCGHGEIITDETTHSCPRCGASAWADVGSKHRLLRLRTARAAGSEEGTRVYDETDDRRREQYDVVTTVDVDPAHVSGAWQLVDKAFGAEFARHTDIRLINFGLSVRQGEKIRVDGKDVNATRFTVCGQCGAERESRRRPNETDDHHHHQGWCKVRSGAVAADWQALALFHQLTTDAVRVLLPVSMFEIEERLASFKGALLLGLRRDFGGDPDHLDILPCELPNPHGQGRYRFLALYDRVPGGTGYLDRLADPDRMRTILEGARQAIARCQCVNEGRQACHRCLLGVIDRHEYELVSRDLALHLLDDLLSEWEVDDTIATVGSVDIGKVEESELERRFKVALQDWAKTRDDVAIAPAVGHDGRDAWELRFGTGYDIKRYRIEEQEGMGTTPSTIPDFVIRRVDATGTDVAVYLDGFQFHASEDHPNIAADAEKRRGVRAAGHLVWSMVWDDVESFHDAVRAAPPRTPPFVPLLTGMARNNAKQTHSQRPDRPDRLDYETLDKNPMSLLLTYLEHPGEGQWGDLAASLVAGFASVGSRGHIAGANIGTAVETASRGDEIALDSDGPLLASSWANELDLRLTAFLDLADPAAERWTVVAAAPDAPDDYLAAGHRARWRSWLHWTNALQFLGPVETERTAWMAATTEAGSLDQDDLWILTRGSAEQIAARVAEPASAVDLSEAMVEELDLIADGPVRTLVTATLDLGSPDFVAGFEVDGIPIEAAWQDSKVGVMPNDDTTIEGWDIRSVHQWTAKSLHDAVTGNG